MGIARAYWQRLAHGIGSSLVQDKTLLKVGMGGTIVAAVCCFTPALVVLVGLVGLSAIVGWLDYGLFPLLFASMGLIAYALHLRSGRMGASPAITVAVLVIALSGLLFWLEFKFALRISVGAAIAVAVYAYYLRVCARRQNDQSVDTRDAPS